MGALGNIDFRPNILRIVPANGTIKTENIRFIRTVINQNILNYLHADIKIILKYENWQYIIKYKM